MSLIVIDMQTNKYWLMTKGADSIVLPRCRFANDSIKEKTDKDLY